MPDPVREDPVNRQMEEAQALKADVENLEDGIFVPEPACEVEVIAEERPAPAGPHSAIFHYVGFAPWRAIDLNGSASRVCFGCW
ncbi:hypothetical protein Y1Q_0023173 [Alligator mississippiensis]|uniref:Uncharacterized protein n=1 Tax=Alligator mississippiensis TaxID=8496 RepID=A0A151MZ77_ALLMI|nr:hypothetical protein Y1Q_0023173 [Alligator mississippiensis]